MLVFVEGGKPENPERNPRSKDENQQQTQPTYHVESGIRTRATLVGGKCSHHCAIPTPLTFESADEILSYDGISPARTTDTCFCVVILSC